MQLQFHSASSVEIAGNNYTFKPQRHVVIKFGQDYGLVFIFAGAVMTLIGIVLSVWHPSRRLCLVTQVVGDDLRFSFICGVVGVKSPRWFAELVQNINTGLMSTVQGLSDKKGL